MMAMVRHLYMLSREVVGCPPLEMVGWGFEQPGRGKDVPVCVREAASNRL